ncbi:Hypothetical protein AA314_07818 [Archangium gephyra]|uniref:Uncharacterized protein n=1 Tax=Archangium gephyra TaxID=48 RepID=A0AAC8THD4_9BACT|nr:Hypothetical protein AA314_07818 [Archangium gephyra]
MRLRRCRPAPRGRPSGRRTAPAGRCRREGRGWSASDSGAPGPGPGRCEASPGESYFPRADFAS